MTEKEIQELWNSLEESTKQDLLIKLGMFISLKIFDIIKKEEE